MNDRDSEYQMNQFWMTLERPVNTGGNGFDFGGRIDAAYGTDWRWNLNNGLENHINAFDGQTYGMMLPQAYAAMGYNELTVKFGTFEAIMDYGHELAHGTLPPRIHAARFPGLRADRIHQRISQCLYRAAETGAHGRRPVSRAAAGAGRRGDSFGLAPISLFTGAATAALLVGLGAEIISQSSRVKEETALAILHTVAFSAGIVLLNFAPVHVDILHYLFGNILGVSNTDLWTTYGISFATVATLVILQRPLLLMLFDQSVAATQGVNVAVLNYLLITLLVLAMISSLQAVGVILALGLLVAPAATVYLVSDSCTALFWGGGIIGLFGSCGGLLLSYWLNLPSGACIVLFLGLLFCLAYVFSPRYGLLRRFIKRNHYHSESLARWTTGEK